MTQTEQTEIPSLSANQLRLDRSTIQTLLPASYQEYQGQSGEWEMLTFICPTVPLKWRIWKNLTWVSVQIRHPQFIGILIGKGSTPEKAWVNLHRYIDTYHAPRSLQVLPINETEWLKLYFEGDILII